MYLVLKIKIKNIFLFHIEINIYPLVELKS